MSIFDFTVLTTMFLTSWILFI